MLYDQLNQKAKDKVWRDWIATPSNYETEQMALTDYIDELNSSMAIDIKCEPDNLTELLEDTSTPDDIKAPTITTTNAVTDGDAQEILLKLKHFKTAPEPFEYYGKDIAAYQLRQVFENIDYARKEVKYHQNITHDKYETNSWQLEVAQRLEDVIAEITDNAQTFAEGVAENLKDSFEIDTEEHEYDENGNIID